MTPVIPAKLPDPPLPRAAPHAGPGTVAAQPRHAAPGRDGAGIWLNAAAVGLLALSGAAAAVSFSARLLQYTAARGGDLAPISPDFAAICDQFDRADAMLYDLRHRTSQGERSPGPAWPGIDGQPIIALARREAGTKTVTFVLDGATANAAIYAIVAHATEREARIREVQRKAQTFPEKSHGRTNRRTIAARETRITTRLRAVEQAYQQALEFQGTPSLKPPDMTIPASRTPDREPELE